MKKNFANFGIALSRDEAKKVLGGVIEYETDDDGASGGQCCAHNADWSWQYCGVDMSLSEARGWATDRAIQTGQRHFYCCASC